MIKPKKLMKHHCVGSFSPRHVMLFSDLK